MSETKTKRRPIPVSRRIAYCKHENRMQGRVYPGQIQKKKLKKETANDRYQIIAELGEMCALLESKNISWYELLEFINDLPIQKPGN